MKIKYLLAHIYQSYICFRLDNLHKKVLEGNVKATIKFQQLLNQKA